MRRAAFIAALLALWPAAADPQGLPSANQVYAGPSSGPAAAPSFRGLVSGDLPAGLSVACAGLPALTGDTTSSAGSCSTTIANNAVTNAKAAQAGANTMKGNWTGSTANEADNAMPSCPDSGGNHLNYVSGTGITCGTSGGGASSGTLVSIVTYNSTQTITIPATATKAFIRMTGGTGGTGGTAAACNTTGCSTGASGAPGYLEKYLTGLTAGNTLAFTQGAAGSAGANTGTAGGNGSASTLASGTQTITTLTANGSNGSAGATVDATQTNMTAGGTATNGDLNITGIGSISVGGTPLPNFFTAGGAGLFFQTGARTGNAGNTGLMVIMWFTWNLPVANDNEPMRSVA